MPVRPSYGALVLALVSSLGCDREPETKYSPLDVARVLGVRSADLRAAIVTRVGSDDRPAWVTPSRWERTRGTYQRFGHAPLWLEEGGVQARATALLDAIRTAPEHALDTTAYPMGEIERVVDAKRLTDSASAGTIADADVLLTSAYVAYAADMLAGQVDPKTVSQGWFIPASPKDIDSAIVRGVEGADMKASLAAMAPQDPDYGALRTAYARYRRIAASGGWPAVSAGRDRAATGELHTRLAAEFEADTGRAETRGADSIVTGPAHPVAATATGVADAHTGELVRRFQRRYGLEPTGRLNAATVAALNVSPADRAQQIGANLERHRWLPRYLGARYIYVNVPAFRLDAYDGGRKELSMKVVVGEEFEGRVTPVFSDSMETVAFRPYWNVTPDIQREEIAPKVARDPGYLARQDMEYFKDGGTTRIRQRPGERNSLGLVKFLFPNSYNVYLHDTPAKALFAKADRAASHGCIRLERPAALAEWVLGWSPDKVHTAMQTGRDNQSVKLSQKLPVYIVYFTAYVRDGELYFGDDIYGRDEKLKEAVGIGSD
ncbi:MAG TPA: L,D-transpeptidase family protein [Gemmatimonadaceae bacterium]|nr:L,D-transpeptidase family protein [Gemmatimonadaceae bacterium]